MLNNNKPKWQDAPKWANYLAMDSDFHWFWHEKKPMLGNINRTWISTGRMQSALKTYLPPFDSTLEMRP